MLVILFVIYMYGQEVRAAASEVESIEVCLEAKDLIIEKQKDYTNIKVLKADCFTLKLI